MKKTDTDQSKLAPDANILKTHEDFIFEQAEMGWENDQRQEEEAFVKQVKNLNKSELIQLIRDARAEAEQFSGWLLTQNWGIIEVRAEYERLRQEKHHRATNQKKGRQEQAKKAVAVRSEAQALGVDDFYQLLREAITQFDQRPTDQPKKQTKIKVIREIIVDLLLQQDYSRHDYDRDKWTVVVKRNVESNHIGVATNQLKNLTNKAT
jgi:hypothetical protein